MEVRSAGVPTWWGLRRICCLSASSNSRGTSMGGAWSDPSGRQASVSMTNSRRSSPRRHRSMHHASASTIQYLSTCSSV